MKKRVVAVLLGCAMVMGMLAGCGGNKDAGTTSDASKSSDAEEKYGIVVKTLSSEYWQSIEEGIQAKADEMDVNVEVLGANSEDDVEGQVNVFETMIQSGEYSAFAVAPLSDSNLINAIAEANDKGYLVGNLDDAIDADALSAAGGSLVFHVATDNVEVGEKAGEYIASLLEEGDEVAIIEGKAGAKGGEDRKEGVTKAFNDAKLEIVDSQPADWDKTKAYDLATNLINKNANLKAIYCCNDTMAMGALQAVENSGKDIIVVGTDGNADAIESVKAGGLTATVAQDTKELGAKTLEMLVKAYRDGEKPGDSEMQEEGIAPILVTKDAN